MRGELDYVAAGEGACVSVGRGGRVVLYGNGVRLVGSVRLTRVPSLSLLEIGRASCRERV